jgi:DNA repair exonuclease SbcCD ATPase subunit
MINFKTIRYKNILSTGNTFTEIRLDKNPTTLIIGSNGSGKSTFLDAISFALFGKPFRRINKPQLLNSINNKNMLIEVEFMVGTKEYLIRRGIKPNIFEIWQDGTLLNQDAASKDYQEVLEKTILKLNHKSFCQIIILGSSTFVPFMQLPQGQRREIIEDLLDIQIFSRMNTILKDKILQNRNDIQEVKYQLELIKEKILVHKNLINKLRKNNDDQIKELKVKIDQAEEKINGYMALIEAKQNEETELRNSIQDNDAVSKKRNTILDLIRSLTDKSRKLNNEIQFYHNNDNCPTCKQGIDHEFKDETLNQKIKSRDETDDAITQLNEQLVVVDTRVSEINNVLNEISAIQRKISEYNGHISSGLQFIKDSKDELERLMLKKTDSPQELEELESLKNEYIEKEKHREELLIQKEVLDVASVLLKDGGIKARIIKQYIPVINKLINKYLSIMELPISFELDENFNETLKSRFRDTFSYDSFSEGEKQRIDLAILFTWRAIAKMRNSSNSNLLVMDEIFDSSIDVGGVEQLTTIIQSISGDSNVFIISHKESMIDKFTNIIKFEKHKDFSRIAA